MNNGEWMAILQYLAEKNKIGRLLICDCGQCNGSYINERAYINKDGDFVLSEKTLIGLLSDCQQSFESLFGNCGSDTSRNGFYYNIYRNKQMNAIKNEPYISEDARIVKELVKIEYGDEENERKN